MNVALIMAGGRSERMRATLGCQHKALVRVLGVCMLERNICKLLSFGFREIVVAISSRSRRWKTTSKTVARRWSPLVAKPRHIKGKRAAWHDRHCARAQ